MKVVVVAAFPTADSGGAGRVAHEFAHELARAHEVFLLCPGKETTLEVSPSGTLRTMRVAAAGEGDVVLPDLRVQRRLEGLVETFDPDVIHAHDFGFLSLLLQDWAKKVGKPFVVTLHVLPSRTHGFVSSETSAIARWLGRSPLFGTFVRMFLKRCDGVIALNRAMEEDLRRLGYRGRVYRIPNGRDLRAYQSLPFAEVREPVKGLLFVGSFARRKNQGYLLEVMEHLSIPARLELVGAPVEPAYLAGLQETIRARGLRGVEIVGPIPYSEVPERLARAHLFVSASRLEVQSLAVIEALASGTPVVGLGNETIDELVDDRVGKRLRPDASPAEFAREVERICTLSPENYLRMCRAARDRVRDLDWQAVLEGTAQVYRELSEARARRNRLSLWSPWIVTASSVRYGLRDFARLGGPRRFPRPERRD